MKMPFRASVTLLCWAMMPACAAPPPEPAFITMQGPDLSMDAIREVVSTTGEAGGHVYHVMPAYLGPERTLSGCCLIASVPPPIEPLVMAMPFVTGIFRGLVDPVMLAPMGDDAMRAVGAWNYLLDEGEIPAPPPGLEPFPNDALEVVGEEPLSSDKTGLPARAPAPLGAPSQTQTSEFMIGSVAIGVVLPESNGSGENWSNSDPLYPGQNRQQLVYNKIVSGANWWGTSGGTSAGLTFFYDQRFGLATQYEPITISSANNGEGLWISDTLSGLGYSTGTVFDRTYAYDNAIRTTFGTDWAFSVFVADSLNDTDDMFPNSTSAFAYLYGPYMVMTYDNGTVTGSWKLSRMNQVFAHEMGHIFGAPDEYAGAGTCTCSNYGYLGVTNGNCFYCVGTQATCVMASNTLQLCSFTPGHVGWRDSDGDSIFDPVDVALTFTSAYLDYGPTPPYSGNPQITGHGTVQAGAWPSPTRTPVSINSVRVSYSVDAGPFSLAIPRDGAFDSDFENFDFTSAALINGPHVVGFSASDNWGNSGAGAPQTIFIDTTPPPAAPPQAIILEAPYSSNPTIATVSWAPAPVDPESGIAGHQVTLRRPGLIAPVASQYVPMPQPMWPFTGLTLIHGGGYYADVVPVNGAGLAGPLVSSPTLTIDLTPPGPPAPVLDGGAGTDQYDRLSFSWGVALEDFSPITDYSLQIFDDMGGLVWGGWLGSPATSYTAMGLSLNLGTKYVGIVSAQNAAGLVGPLSAPSDGIMAVQFIPSIGLVKTTTGPGMAVGVRQVYVTSSGTDQPGVIYAQHLNRTAGIRTDSSDAIGQGYEVDIAGLVSHGSNGEVQLKSSEVAPTGIVLPGPQRPLGVSGRALGGGVFGLQAGVINGSGANNVGLLVQTWGTVTYVSPGPPYYFVLDDGSGVTDQTGLAGVGVRCGSVTPPALGAFVKVKGVCSYENGYPVVLIRQTGDWW